MKKKTSLWQQFLSEVSSLESVSALPSLLRRVREISASCEQTLETKRVRVAVLGNSTMKPFCDFLGPCLLASEINAEIWEAPFDQWQTQLFARDSEMWAWKPDFLILFLSSLGLTAVGTKSDIDPIEVLCEGIERLQDTSLRSSILLILPEPLEEGNYVGSRLYQWREQAIRMLFDRLRGKCHFLDPLSVLSEIGKRKWYAARYWYHAKMACHPNALLSLARETAFSISGLLRPRIKVVVCDLDDTLWGGVVGEAGVWGLELDVFGKGAAFLRLQAYLKELSLRGILLAAVSKNNEADVREVFECRKEMILKWENFTCVLANWESKAKNLSELAMRLGVGLESFCFIDNSPTERAEVRFHLPEVCVPELPDACEDFVPFLAASGLFRDFQSTEEDERRAELYRSYTRYQAELAMATDRNEFLKGLGIQLTALAVDEKNAGRVAQLFQKTNQFNLTGVRFTLSQVLGYAANPENFFFAYQVVDRFGDHGVVGVLLMAPNGRGTYRTLNWVLSCRVLGRGIERAIFAHAHHWLSQRGISRVRAQYLGTAKNLPAKNALPELGFTPCSEEEDWEYPVQRPFVLGVPIGIRAFSNELAGRENSYHAPIGRSIR